VPRAQTFDNDPYAYFGVHPRLLGYRLRRTDRKFENSSSGWAVPRKCKSRGRHIIPKHNIIPGLGYLYTLHSLHRCTLCFRKPVAVSLSLTHSLSLSLSLWFYIYVCIYYNNTYNTMHINKHSSIHRFHYNTHHPYNHPTCCIIKRENISVT